MGAPITIKKRVVSPKKPNPITKDDATPETGAISGRTVNVKLADDETGESDASSGGGGNTVNVKLPAVDATNSTDDAAVTQKKTAAPTLSRRANKDKPKEQKEAEPAVFVSKPSLTGGSGKPVSSKANVVAAVFALVATLIFFFVLLLQVTELIEIRQFFPQPVGVVTTTVFSAW